jgi:hypothetical protein
MTTKLTKNEKAVNSAIRALKKAEQAYDAAIWEDCKDYGLKRPMLELWQVRIRELSGFSVGDVKPITVLKRATDHDDENPF